MGAPALLALASRGIEAGAAAETTPRPAAEGREAPPAGSTPAGNDGAGAFTAESAGGEPSLAASLPGLEDALVASSQPGSGEVSAAISSSPASAGSGGVIATSLQPAGGEAPAARPAAALAAPALSAAADAQPPECALTPLSPTALAEALRQGHIRHFGAPPHADRWSCAWAHCAFEQASGGAIYGNNLGHLTARSPTEPGRYVPRGTPPARPPGRVCLRRMRERVTKNPDRWVLVDVWFRAFDTPAEGAEAYWRLLANSYHSVLARCDEADPRGAAQRLADIGYFTGPEAPYIDGMARLFLKARGSLIPRMLPLPGEGTGQANTGVR